MVRFTPAIRLKRSDQIDDGVVTKPKLSFTAADVAIQNAFMDAQKIYAPDKSQLLLFRDSGLTQGASLAAYSVAGEIGLVANGFHDGTSYQRFNTSYPLLLLYLSTSYDRFSLYRAAAGANPATLTEIFRIRSDGRIMLPEIGSVITSGFGKLISYGYNWDLGVAYLESDAYSYACRSGEIHRVQISIGNNTLNADTPAYLNVSGTLNSLFTIPAATTGLFEWNGAISVAKDSKLQYRFDCTGSTSGYLGVASASLTMR